MEPLPAVVGRRLDEVEFEQAAGDQLRQLVSEHPHRAIDADVGAGHHAVTDAVLAQVRVEVALLVVLALADVHRHVDVPVGLSAVGRQALPAEVILQSDAAQRARYRLGRVAVPTRPNALRVSENAVTI